MAPRDDLFDYLPVPDERMALRIAGQVASVGALCGSVEALEVARRAPFGSTLTDRLELLAVTVPSWMGLAWTFGLLGGLWAQRRMRDVERWRRYRLGFVAGTMGCVVTVITPSLLRVTALGDVATSIAFGILLLFVGGTAWANAGYWYRRELLGAAPRLPWWVIAGTGTILLSGFAALQQRPEPERTARLRGEPADVVIVTLSGLRVDAIADGTPALQGIAREGLAAEGAISEFPATAPAHATLWTGLTTWQHGVRAEGTPLREAPVTLAEQLRALGWRTGAFVSSRLLGADSGLAQGFDVYDDALAPRGRLALRSAAGRLGFTFWSRRGDPAAVPSLLRRPGQETVGHALEWAASVPRDAPMLLWVHLHEPHLPLERAHAEDASRARAYAEAVATADGALAQLRKGLEGLGRKDSSILVIASDHGERLEAPAGHHGLSEEVLRVPLLVAARPQAWPAGTRLREQVGLEVVPNTVLRWLGVPALQGGVDLGMRALGTAVAEMPLLLEGRSEAGDPVEGVRSNGMKLVRDARGERLHDLTVDPSEKLDASAQQPAAAAAARTLLAGRPPAREPTREDRLLEGLRDAANAGAAR